MVEFIHYVEILQHGVTKSAHATDMLHVETVARHNMNEI